MYCTHLVLCGFSVNNRDADVWNARQLQYMNVNNMSDLCYNCVVIVWFEHQFWVDLIHALLTCCLYVSSVYLLALNSQMDQKYAKLMSDITNSFHVAGRCLSIKYALSFDAQTRHNQHSKYCVVNLFTAIQ